MRFSLVFVCVLVCVATLVVCDDRVLLRSVSAITLREGVTTAGRRSAGVPQLSCVGNCICPVRAAQCKNVGWDGRDVQWECTAELPSDTTFDRVEVSCEGYDHPDDPYVLVGSCGLEYSLRQRPAANAPPTKQPINIQYTNLGNGTWNIHVHDDVDAIYNVTGRPGITVGPVETPAPQRANIVEQKAPAAPPTNEGPRVTVLPVRFTQEDNNTGAIILIGIVVFVLGVVVCMYMAPDLGPSETTTPIGPRLPPVRHHAPAPPPVEHHVPEPPVVHHYAPSVRHRAPVTVVHHTAPANDGWTSGFLWGNLLASNSGGSSRSCASTPCYTAPTSSSSSYSYSTPTSSSYSAPTATATGFATTKRR